jgi:SAM-dependent methyltransferase
MSPKDFYESYWGNDKAPPQLDPTTGERMDGLGRVLRSIRQARGLDRLQVLDAGCGDGIFVAFVRELGFQVSGIDVSDAAIERAKTRCPDADLRVASLEDQLPFPDATFDAVWCTEVLEHIFNVHAALAELNRVLLVRGSLILTTPYHGFVKNLLIALSGFDRHFNPEISHIRFFTRATLDRCLRRAGFVPIEWAGVGRMWPLWKSFFLIARKERRPGEPPAIIG